MFYLFKRQPNSSVRMLTSSRSFFLMWGQTKKKSSLRIWKWSTDVYRKATFCISFQDVNSTLLHIAVRLVLIYPHLMLLLDFYLQKKHFLGVPSHCCSITRTWKLSKRRQWWLSHLQKPTRFSQSRLFWDAPGQLFLLFKVATTYSFLTPPR